MKPRFNVPRNSGPLVTLADGSASVVLAPECGARIVSFRVDDRNVLRAASPEALATGISYGFAGFPLMPYSGPIFGGGFQFGSQWHPLARNVPEEPTATHGEGWIRPWTVRSQSDNRVELTMDHMPAAGEFPFAWRGNLTFLLEANHFVIELRLTCRDHRPMPAGIGFHPYFPKPPGTRLQFQAAGMWPADAPEAVGLPCGPLLPGLDFSNGLDASEIVLDRCFEGWDRRAEVHYPDGFITTITAEGALEKLQIYDAWDYLYVCVEPVSNANDGFNRMAHNVPCHSTTILNPGQSLWGRLAIGTHPSQR
jgi:aldose 1-epimerase